MARRAALVLAVGLVITGVAWGSDAAPDNLLEARHLKRLRAWTEPRVAANPNDAAAYYERGNLYLDNDKFDDALADYNKAVDLGSKNPFAFAKRGNAFYKKKDYDLAISNYNIAITIKPTLQDVYFQRGMAYADKKDYDTAITDYTKSIELKPGLPKPYFLRGIAYIEKKNYEAAVADLTKNIEINTVMLTKYPEPYRYRALAYDALGQKDKADADRKLAKDNSAN